MKRSIQVEETLYRSGTSSVGEDGKIKISISSDAPYLRYDWMNDEEYWEVLDHSAKGVDTSRLAGGAALLFNHNRNIHIGILDEPTIENGKCYVQARVSKAPDVESYRVRMDEGILKDTSVGYGVEDDGECIGAKDGKPIYKFRWFPHEASMVTIPADTTVGMGRQMTRELAKKASENDELPALKEICVECKSDVDNQHALTKSQPTKPPVMPEPLTPAEQKIETDTARNAAVAEFKNRCKAIDDFVAHTEKQPTWHKTVVEIAQKHKSGEADFQAFCTEANLAHPGQKAVMTEDKGIGMNQREIKSFSFLRAIHGLGTGRGLQGLEKEASDAHGKQIGHECGPNSFFVPMDVQRGGAFPRGIDPEQLRSMDFTNPQTRALFTNLYSAAGAFVGTELMGGSLIELLRNQMLVFQMGARTMSGLSGSNIAIPRQTGGATASWLAEDSTIAASNQTVGQLNLTPHKLAAATAYTEQFAMQSSVDAENFVRQDLAAVTAIARDLAAIAGTGVSGQPIGILNLGSTNLSTPVTLSAAQSMTYANAVKFELNVSLNNANRGKLGYMTSPTVKNNAKLIAEISSTNSNPVWKDDKVNGYPALATNQIPTATSVIFGNWDDLILVDFAQSNFFVDPYSLSMQGQIRVINRLYCDNGVRHGTSFAVAVG